MNLLKENKYSEETIYRNIKFTHQEHQYLNACKVVPYVKTSKFESLEELATTVDQACLSRTKSPF